MGRKSLQAEKRLEILSHFNEAIVEEGLEGATTGNVARRMGIKTSLLMHYFPSKESMVEAMIAKLVSSYEEKFLASIELQVDPKERLVYILHQLLGPTWEETDQTKLFYTCYSLIFRHEGIKQEFQTLFQIFRQFLVKELHYSMEQGVIPHQPPEAIADLIITIVEGKGIFHQIVDDADWAVEQRTRLFDWIWRILSQNITKSASTGL